MYSLNLYLCTAPETYYDYSPPLFTNRFFLGTVTAGKMHSRIHDGDVVKVLTFEPDRFPIAEQSRCKKSNKAGSQTIAAGVAIPFPSAAELAKRRTGGGGDG